MKRLLLVFAIAFLSIAFCTSLAEAQPLSEDEILQLSLPEETSEYSYRLSDGNVNSYIAATPGTEISFYNIKEKDSILLEWFEIPSEVSVAYMDLDGNELTSETISGLYENLLVVPEACSTVKLSSSAEMKLSEITKLSKEDAEAYIPLVIPEKVDMMIVCAHFGDETIKFGGLIPYYASVRNLSTVSVILSYQSRKSIKETLNAQRICGENNQPYFFNNNYISLDPFHSSLRQRFWDKKTNISRLTSLIRQLCPEVVVTHSMGEEEDGMRLFTAELTSEAVKNAALKGKDTASAREYGLWTVSKLYTCLEADEADAVSVPYNAMLPDGMDVFEKTEQALSAYRSLAVFRNKPPKEVPFHLSFSQVGNDSTKDLFDNISAERLTNQEEARDILQKAAKAVSFFTGSKNENMINAKDDVYFRHAGETEEVVVADEEKGHWEYRSDLLSILIDRKHTKDSDGKPVVYFVAHIRMREVNAYRSGFGCYNEMGSAKSMPWEMARNYKAVLAITGDNLVNAGTGKKGVLIRKGRLYFKGTHRQSTMALTDDMRITLYEKGTPSEVLVQDGIQDSYGFGPILVQDSKIHPDTEHSHVSKKNPRCGIGMVEPGHYVAIVADGRQASYSVGFTLEEYAQVFLDEGCTVAYNMDGGVSAGMVFMGENINRHKGGTGSYQRPWPDGLLFGYSELVPDITDPIINKGNGPAADRNRAKMQKNQDAETENIIP